ELCESTTARVFVGGDAADLPRSVADALGSGKRAALGIDQWLRERAGEQIEPLDIAALRFGSSGNISIARKRGTDPLHRAAPVNEVVGFDDMNPAHFEPAARNEDRFHSAGDITAAFGEVNFGLSDRQVASEVARCMNCGVCNRCELCLIFCPDMAIHRREDGEGFEIDLRYCKGCGLCAAECPRGAMAMSREES
ncbi:MAG: 4Fe-4S dicluster domain-containing protein, partial [Gemmatimonadota bacterium]